MARCARLRIIETRRKPRFSNLWRTYEIGIKEVDRADVSPSQIPVVDAAVGVFLKVLIVKRQLGVDLAEEGFETVADLAMPWKELGAAVDMGGSMNFVLFEPLADASRRCLARRA